MKFISELFAPAPASKPSHEIRYNMLNRYILLFSLCGHTLFIPIFFLLHRSLPFYNNLICIFIDILCLFLNSRWKMKTVYVLYIAEITYHATICNIIFRPGAGNIFYFGAIASYIFLFNRYGLLRVTMFVSLLLVFVAQYFYMNFFTHEYPVTIIPVWIVYFSNAAASFCAIAFITTEFSAFADKAEIRILKAKEKAEEGERAKSIFLANMSHEIRSPLNSIIGMINLTLMLDKDKEQKQYLHIAKDSADHMLTVINDILDYSKIEMKCMHLNNEVFDIYHLIKNTMIAMDSSVYNKKLQMEYEISADVPKIVKGDPSRIRQVLINLISNAIKFTEKGSIIVKCKNISDDDNSCTLEFSVQDTGIGIPEDRISSIFNRFTQVDLKESNNYSGTGLGLAISKELIELMGGTITVESRPGEGSIFTFRIYLDRAVMDEKNENLSEMRPDVYEKKSLKVLIAEDIFTNWMLYEKYMQKLGHSFKIVENGKEAINELEHNRYDIILMDVEMPEMNGEETLRLIRSGIRGIQKDIPVIALTGYTEFDLKKTDYKFNGFLIKPIELDDLEKKIDEVMDQAESSSL